jgi:hypothetical protein
MDDAKELETWGPGIQLVEEWYFSQDPGLDRLSWLYQRLYRLAGHFAGVRRAHRIVIYQLSGKPASAA